MSSLDLAARRAQQIEAAHVDHFVDDVAQESSRDFSFQRVSDDEQGLAQAEPVRESPLPGAAKRETAAERRRKKTGVIGRLFKSKKSEDDENAGDSGLSSESTSEAVPDSQASITSGRPHEEFATRRGGWRRGSSFTWRRSNISASRAKSIPMPNAHACAS